MRFFSQCHTHKKGETFSRSTIGMSVIDEFSEQITDAVVVLYCSTVTKREFEQSSMWKLVEQRHYIDLCYMMETEAVTLHE